MRRTKVATRVSRWIVDPDYGNDGDDDGNDGDDADGDGYGDGDDGDGFKSVNLKVA